MRFPEVHDGGHPDLCERASSSRGSRGYAPMRADGWDTSLLYAVLGHCPFFLFPCTLYSHSQDPRGSGEDATPRQDTRQDR